MTIEQMNSFVNMQKRQLRMTLAACIASMVGLVAFAALAFNGLVHSQVAHAQTAPVYSAAASSDPNSCSVPNQSNSQSNDNGGVNQSAGNVFQSSTGGHGGGYDMPIPGLGKPGTTVTESSYVYHYQDSNNTYGSYNGSNNNTSTTNTQGSYNDVGGDLNQINAAKNNASNDTDTKVKDSGNPSDSHDTNNTNTAVDSGNSTSNTETNTNNTTDSAFVKNNN